MPAGSLSKVANDVRRVFSEKFADAIERIVHLQGPAETHRPFDAVRAATAGSCFLDGCAQWSQILEECVEIAQENASSSGEELCLGPNIGDYGGWIQFHAAELLAELVTLRTGLPSPHNAGDARRQFSSAPTRTPSFQSSRENAGLRRTACQIIARSDGSDVDGLVEGMCEVYACIGTSVEALKAVCIIRPKMSCDATLAGSTESDWPRFAIDCAIVSLSELIAAFARFAASWDKARWSPVVK